MPSVNCDPSCTNAQVSVSQRIWPTPRGLRMGQWRWWEKPLEKSLAPRSALSVFSLQSEEESSFQLPIDIYAAYISDTIKGIGPVGYAHWWEPMRKPELPPHEDEVMKGCIKGLVRHIVCGAMPEDTVMRRDLGDHSSVSGSLSGQIREPGEVGARIEVRKTLENASQNSVRFLMCVMGAELFSFTGLSN
ncbi:hypothetical protein Scep_012625 [Stephania cephalantha]|uniref:Uncharacterized protein n=1 Tax=Stephania cephalantha TaxID=152367 RepID=A0AAP0JHP1_9MAGN